MISPVKVWRRQKFIRDHLGKVGTIVTWTYITVAGSSNKEFAPYPVVLVSFGKGDSMYGQFVDYRKEDLAIGKKVISVLRKVRKPKDDGVIPYGIKFKPKS